MIQGGEDTGIRGPASVPEGQPIPIEVRIDGIDHVLVSDGLPDSKPIEVPVGPGGQVVLQPEPGWIGGTILIVYTPTPPVRAVLIEIVSTAP